MTGLLVKPIWALLGSQSKQLMRGVTTASAIQRGIGKSQRDVHRQIPEEEGAGSSRSRGRFGSIPERRTQDRPVRSSRNDSSESLGHRFETSRPPSSSQRRKPGHQQGYQDRRTSTVPTSRNSLGDSGDRRGKVSRARDRMPISIPHTTAASEFLYGRSPVEAAIRSRRRSLYKLYIHNPRDIPLRQLALEEPVIELARAAGVKVESVLSDQLHQKISSGRPTNVR